MAQRSHEADETHTKHKRTPSNVIKSMVTTQGQKATASKQASPSKAGARGPTTRTASKGPPTLPAQSLDPSPPLGEILNNRERIRSPPRGTAIANKGENHQSPLLHKRNKSAVSLKGLGRKNSQKSAKSKVGYVEDKEPLKKSKSSTNLAAIFSRPKSSKGGSKEEDSVKTKGKENQTPSQIADEAPPPIWAQFANPQTHEIKRTTKIPLNDKWDVEDEVALYTPQEYSPSKGRNFFEQPPTLAGKDLPKPRPRSGILSPSPSTNSFIDTLTSLKQSSTSTASASSEQRTSNNHPDRSRKASREDGRLGQHPAASEDRKISDGSARPGLTIAKRGSRVMAAVAVLNGKSKDVAASPTKKVASNPAEIERAFEKMLVSSQITMKPCLAHFR